MANPEWTAPEDWGCAPLGPVESIKALSDWLVENDHDLELKRIGIMDPAVALLRAPLDLSASPVVISSFNATFGPCQHQWGYASTVGNLTCGKCFERREWDHPDTIAYREMHRIGPDGGSGFISPVVGPDHERGPAPARPPRRSSP